MAARRGSRGGERGSFSVELAVLAPAVLAMVAFIISVGRVTEGRALVQGAARDAARAATINHNGGAASRQAAFAAYRSATDGMDCEQLQLTPAAIVPDVQVQATVTCTVGTMWGRQTITRTATSATDRYRGTD